MAKAINPTMIYTNTTINATNGLWGEITERKKHYVGISTSVAVYSHQVKLGKGCNNKRKFFYRNIAGIKSEPSFFR